MDRVLINEMARHYGVVPKSGETVIELRERIRHVLSSAPRKGLVTMADLQSWIDEHAPDLYLDEIRIVENVGARAGLIGLHCSTATAYVVLLSLADEMALLLPAHVAMDIQGPSDLSSEDIKSIQSAYRIGGVEAARKLVESSDNVDPRK